MTEEELFAQYYKDVYRTCYYMLKSQHDTEDVCQDVFIKIFKQDYNHITNLKPWILSIAMNTSRNHIRKHARVLVGKEFMNWIGNIVDPQRLEEEVESREQRENMVHIIHRLNTKIREVILLKYLHELKNEEIAAVLNIPLGTVKSRANKGILQLRKMMESNGHVHTSHVKGVFK